MKKRKIVVIKNRQLHSLTYSPIITLTIIVILWTPENSTVLSYIKYAIFSCLSSYFILSSSFSGIRSLGRSAFFPYYFFVCLSVLWSDELMHSCLRAVLFSFSVFAAFSMVRLYSAHCILISVCVGLTGFALSGVAAALFFPSIGVEQTWLHAGKWNGLSLQKNVFALNVVLAIMYVLASREVFFKRKLIQRIVINIIICVLLYALVKSGSRSAFLDLLFVLGVVFLVHINWRAARIVLPAALGWGSLVLLICLFFAAEFDDKYIYIGGFQIDTSSRTTIWNYGFDVFRQSELSAIWGMGFGGFWTNTRILEFERMAGWVLPNFHNGYLSVYFELGLIGMLLFFLVLMRSGYLFLSHFQSIKRDKSTFVYFLVFLQFSMHNIYENNLVRSTDIALFLFILSLAGLYSHVSNKKLL